MQIDKRVIALLLIALALRAALFLIVPITGDAIFHYNFTKFIATHLYIPSFEIEVGAGALPYFHPPLQHLLGVPLYWLNPSLPFIAPIIYGVAGLFFLYKLVRLLFNEKIALCSLAIASVFPPLLYYSAINYTDSLMFLCATAAFYFYFSYVKNSSTRFLALSILFSGFALLTHYHGVAVPLFLVFYSIFVRRERKTAILLLFFSLLIASPWYARNFILYGNPVFPVFNIGYYPNAQYDFMPFAESVSSLANPLNWANIFTEFLIGAPNSGDAYSYFPLLEGKIPFFYPLLALWLAIGMGIALIFMRGIFLMLKEKKEHTLPFAFLFLLCTFFLIQTPYPRMYFSLLPFLLAGGAYGFIELHSFFRGKLKENARILFALFCAILILSLLCVTFAYAFTYKTIFEKHLAYYKLIGENTPPGAVILSNAPERIIFYSGRLANYFDDVKGRVPSAVLYSRNISALKDYGITHACCTNLLHSSAEEAEFYNTFTYAPVFKYESGDYSGRCWKI
ncbi:hypothetical protein COV61_05180 [Candidatus Micrarchaeota archaeon CG11_big_fil_rev_8_21_14_0_20_47_5]|nr:MAG: hypothetical protein AUJ17_05075 [Candidatus Micrarchaeota archaeon CG1_02_47_40]PIN82718.1 MAG: hypothetical protein COV61_05180 [Candidatus Micrarchaeota archaeon CG11_big_fil_rev_8_21_14_0_20_47_5]